MRRSRKGMRRSCEGLSDLHNTYSPRDRRPLAIARLHLDLLEFDLLVPRPRPTFPAVELPNVSKHNPTIKRDRVQCLGRATRTAKHLIASSKDEISPLPRTSSNHSWACSTATFITRATLATRKSRFKAAFSIIRMRNQVSPASNARLRGRNLIIKYHRRTIFRSLIRMQIRGRNRLGYRTAHLLE